MRKRQLSEEGKIQNIGLILINYILRIWKKKKMVVQL